MIKNDKIGRTTEKNIVEYFEKHKFWAFNVPKGINGQPFDIIARRKNQVWFIDAKHLVYSKASFPFDRIEPNQETTMDYAKIVADIQDNMGFVIEWERTPGKFYYLSHEIYKEMKKLGEKSVKINSLPVLGDLICR